MRSQHLLTIISLLLLTIHLHAGVETVISYRQGQGISVLPGTRPMVVWDDKYPDVTLGTTAVVMRSEGMVQLEVDRDYSGAIAEETCTLTVSVKRYSSPLSYQTDSYTLEVNYTDDAQSYLGQDFVLFDNVHRMEVSISQIRIDGVVVSSDLSSSPWFKLSCRIETERYYELGSVSSPAKTYLSSTDELLISWPPIAGAEQYQLEWCWVNDYATNNGQLPPSSVTFDFDQNSTRITTHETSYRLSNIYDRGYLVYRIRGVGRKILYPQMYDYTAWSISPSQGTISALSSQSYHQISSSHQSTMNWQYSGSYAEGGKKKEVVTYYDGALRSRQVVSRLSSTGDVVVGETIYDAQGRAAVQVLPVPNLDPTNGGKLQFAVDFNRPDGLSAGYYWEHFDTDNTSNPCQSNLQAMDQTRGAAQYYSASNTDMDAFQAYVPVAGGYPFSQVEYTADNTGRIRRQGGVGAQFQLGTNPYSDHSTKYLYSQPDQEQLDRLFGSEAGYYRHYKKNTIIDANGQVSISYLDPQGRVIATSLAGDAPDNLQSITTDNAELQVVYLSKNAVSVPTGMGNVVADGNSLLFFKQITVPASGVYDFYYSVDVAKLDQLCPGCNFCMDCVYELEISLVNECGEQMFEDGDGLPAMVQQRVGCPSSSPYDLSCAAACSLDVATGYIDNITLSKGSYTLVKRLKIDPEAKEYYTEQYIENSGCVETFDQHLNRAISTLSGFDSCSIDRSDCINSLGASYSAHLSLYGSEAMSQANYLQALADCESMSVPDSFPSECQTLLEMLLMDVSPQGQYAEYGVDANGNYIFNDYNHSLSVFHPNSLLETHGLPSSITGEPWKHPKYTTWNINTNQWEMDCGGDCDYVDKHGNTAYVLVSVDANGDYTPAVDGASDVVQLTETADGSYLPSANGTLLGVKPEDLMHARDFIAHFKPSWALGLVEYHPEYFYYVQCNQIDQTTLGVSPAVSNREFDLALKQCDDFSTANTNYSIDNQDETDLFDQDPYFQSFIASDWQYQEMEDRLEEYYNDQGLSIKDMVTRAILYPNYHDGNYPGLNSGDPEYPISFGTSDTTGPYLDMEWQMYRDLYLSEKRRVMWLDMMWNSSVDRSSYAACSSKYPSFNGCIESKDGGDLNDFNYRKYNYTSNGNSWCTDQVCQGSTILHYKDKIKRFRSSVGLPNEELSDDMSPDEVIAVLNGSKQAKLYKQQGICSIVLQVQSLLNQMAARGILTASSISLKMEPFFTKKLRDECNAAITPSSHQFYAWDCTTNSSSMSARLVDLNGVDVGASFSLSPGPGLTIDWDLVSKVFNIRPTHYDAANDLYHFQASVMETINGSSFQRLVYGTTSFDLYECENASGNFQGPPRCTPNLVGKDLENLLNMLAITGKFNAITDEDLTLSPYASYLTPSIKNAFNSAKPDWDWKANSAQGTEGYIRNHDGATDDDQLRISFTFPTPYDMGDVVYFANLRDYDGTSNEFIITAYVDDPSNPFLPVQVSAVVEVSPYNNGYSNYTGVEVIECTSALPEDCFDPDDIKTHLEKLLNAIASSKAQAMKSDHELAQFYQFTPLLQQALSLGAQPRMNYINGGGECPLEVPCSPGVVLEYQIVGQDTTLGECCLKFWEDGCSTSVDHADIIGFENLQPIGTGYGAPTYDFSITAILIGGTTATLYGTSSCIALESCCEEPPLPPASLVDCQDSYTNHYTSQFTAYGTSHPFYISQEDYCKYSLSHVCSTYVDYLNYVYSTMGINLKTMANPYQSPFFVDIMKFYAINPGNLYIKYIDHMNLLKTRYSYLPESFDQSSPHYMTMDEFVSLGYATYLVPSGGTLVDFIDEFDDDLNTVGDSYILSFPTQKEYAQDSFAASYGILPEAYIPCPALPGYPLVFPTMPEPDPCDTTLYYKAYHNAMAEYQQDIEDARESFEELYTQTCLQAKEDFGVSYTNKEYHYTLYYYDQAGNLVKTIPPEGVHAIHIGTDTPGQTNYNNGEGANGYPSDVFTRIKLDRANDNKTIATHHDLGTMYSYNSLNQLIRQETPDAGVSLFWYDQLGRLVLSQNAQQITEHKYSYTLYDQQGRIVEVGQITKLATDPVMTSAIARMPSELNSWMSNGSRSQVTQTWYDQANGGFTVPDFNQEKHLRGRVAHVSLDRDGDGNYDHATHYSYDIHGNVNMLVQDNPELDTYGHQYKRIQYEYDLVSGNVNQVTYQKGKKDQFMHRYSYDADNRITQVLTSTNGLVWEKDAKYYYYRHGPLARVEVGNDKVQGIDYAYTLQGWLKGVNSDNLTKEYDQGKDSKSASTYMASNPDVHRMVAEDAFGYSLGYFGNDYQYIASNSPPTINSFYSDVSSISNLSSNAPQLYNGNIRLMVTSIYENPSAAQAKPQLTAYTYDQLNRIHGMTSLQASALTGNTWSGNLGSNFETTYSYDGNGNLLTLTRRNENGGLIDDFTYEQDWVNPGDHSKGKASNKLLSVADNVPPTTPPSSDLAGNVNYYYDLTGNLIREDHSLGGEFIKTHIDWTNYGKVEKVEREFTSASDPPSDLEFAYDAMGNRIMKHIIKRNSQGAQVLSTQTYTFYVHDAQGNVMATYRLKEGFLNDEMYLDDWNLYGSSRLGVKRVDQMISSMVNQADFTNPTVAGNIIGNKYFELSNHLGNVLVTISDRRKQVLSGGTVDYYSPDIETTQDYYPFGMLMPGRQSSPGEYRYSFNGMEKDDEWKGSGNSLDFGARIYDPRVGRWLSVDPLAYQFVSHSPYCGFNNNPIIYVDPTGMGGEIAIDREKHTITITCTLVLYSDGSVTQDQITKALETHNITHEPKIILLHEYNNSNERSDDKVPYTVNYNINIQVVTKKEANDMQHNPDYKDNPAVNFFEVREKLPGPLGRAVSNLETGEGQNVGFLSIEGLTSTASQKGYIMEEVWHSMVGAFYQEGQTNKWHSNKINPDKTPIPGVCDGHPDGIDQINIEDLDALFKAAKRFLLIPNVKSTEIETIKVGEDVERLPNENDYEKMESAGDDKI